MLLLIMVLAITVLEACCANISYEEADVLTAKLSQLFDTSKNVTPVFAGIDIVPGLLDGLVMINIVPNSYTTTDIWIAYEVGVMSFDIIRQDYPQIYRSYVNVKIRGKSYIIEVVSPDIEGIPDIKTNQTAYIKYCSEIANELINKQLAYNYPMDEASDYRKSNT
jgi:hypothetical protein